MTPSIPSIAARVYDQDCHSQADLDFLAAISRADNEWHEALQTANKLFGGGSEAWECVKRLATRQRDADYAKALAVFETGEVEDEVLQAAE